MRFPRMVRVRQALYHCALDDIENLLQQQLGRLPLAGRIRPGMKIAITAGSRGIAGLPEVLRLIVSSLESWGAKPFIVPAMGSHGGATAEGQVKVLASLGITERTVGAPIRSSMKVVKIGETNSTPVYMDAQAARANGVVVVNRIKEHTDFCAPIESGLLKMLAIGLGKHAGASVLHALGWERMPETILHAARLVLAKANILCGVGIVEDGYQNIARLEVFRPEEIEEGERRLLRLAKRHASRLPFEEIDVLVVECIGKEISGAGMDPNVTGRYAVPVRRPGRKSRCRTVVVLRLTRESAGNAVGVGLADIATKKLARAMDAAATYANALASGYFQVAKMPLVLENDQQAVAAALSTGLSKKPEEVRMVRIRDTLHLDSFQVSEGLLEEARENPCLSIEGRPAPMRFDGEGNLL